MDNLDYTLIFLAVLALIAVAVFGPFELNFSEEDE